MHTIIKKESLAQVFPNIYNLPAIAQLIPTSIADCEKGLSALKKIKSPERKRLSNKVTVELLFISIEGPSLEDFDFGASKRNRRLMNSS